MKLIDKYIFKQVALATTVGLIIFVIVWIAPETLFKIIKKTIDGQISTITAIKLFFLEMPEILGTLISSSLMLGSIWVFDRLSRDSELTILRGIGVSFFRITLPVLVLSIIGSVACFSIYEYLIPKSTSILKVLNNTTHQDHFVFVDKTPSGKPKEILIVGNFNGKQISNIKLLRFSGIVSEETPLISTIFMADNAIWGKNHWTLDNVTAYRINSDGVYNAIEKLNNTKVLSPDTAQKAYELLLFSTKKSKEMNLATLDNYINLLQSTDMQNEYRYMLNKYYQRFSQAFSCILFALCGAVLGFGRPRERKFLGFTLGVAIIFLYLIMIPFVDVLAQIGIIQPAIAAWIPNLFILSAIIALVKHKQI